MRKMTEQNVKDALAGESQAHIKYLAFSEKAAAENLPNVARAFKAGSFSEQVHATNHLKTLVGIGTTAENLEAKPIRVCSVCGFTMEGDAPDKCPICGAPKEKFVTF